MLQVNCVNAGGVPNVVVEPETPFAGQSINVLVLTGICFPSLDYGVDIQGHQIKVFVRVSYVCGNVDPPPPPTLLIGAHIDGLEAGVYNLEYYRLSESDDFPPLPVDYPLFFVEEIQFEVRGAAEPLTVYATSMFSLASLLFVMLGISSIYLFKSFNK